MMSEAQPENICIFGGAFDPVHQGHLRMARAAKSKLGISLFLWVPAFDSPQKKSTEASFDHRLAMIRIAVKSTGDRVLDIESRLPRPSYTLNSIRAIKSEYGPAKNWYLLLGTDNWDQFGTWYKWKEILDEVTPVVYPRGKAKNAGTGAVFLKEPLCELSSTEIRKSFQAGTVEYSDLTREVRTYIAEHKLYLSPN